MEQPKEFFINCDWLQIHTKHPTDYLTKENPYYLFKKIGQSKVFKNIYEVRDIAMNLVIGNYCTDANECIMSASEGILKFENSQLYCNENLKAFVEKVLNRLRFRFIGITRFDIAFDFQTFAGGLHPQWFIQKYIKGEILRVTNGGGKNQVGFVGQQKNNKIIVETLNFGSKSSDVNFKLYNKTKELENSLKPWIKKAHKVNFEDQTKDVWRLEFSMFSLNAFFQKKIDVQEKIKHYLAINKFPNKGMKELEAIANKDLLKENRGNSFHSLEVLDIAKMYGIFQGLFNHYFRFKKKVRKTRLTRMPELTLWKFEVNKIETKLIKSNPILKQSSRSEKIFLRKMDAFNKEFRLFDENFSFTAKELISKIINMHSLEQWAVDNEIEFEGHENYANDVLDFYKADGLKLSLDNNLRVEEKKKIKNFAALKNQRCETDFGLLNGLRVLSARPQREQLNEKTNDALSRVTRFNLLKKMEDNDA